MVTLYLYIIFQKGLFLRKGPGLEKCDYSQIIKLPHDDPLPERIAATPK
jgi:hypothetical protein